MSVSHSPKLDSLSPVCALANHDLDPLFWRPEVLHPHSAWCGHISFAHWVVRVISPRTLVELGTHTGVSYSAFCLAVEREKLDAKCFAVGSWMGDQAGYYGDEVFSALKEDHRSRFSAFSTLIRCHFDDAVAFFLDNSIDLLHIHGFQSYEAVKSHFSTWRVKLSCRAIILFHNSNVLRDDVGIWKFWAEIRKMYPSFEFTHGNGLGMLVVGDKPSPSIIEFCHLTDSAELATLRDRFALIGERWEVEAKWQAEQQTLNKNVSLTKLRRALWDPQQESTGTVAADETAIAETMIAREVAHASAYLLADVETGLEQVRAEVSPARETTRRSEVEIVYAERENSRLQRKPDKLVDWAATEHNFLLRELFHAHEATIKAQETSQRQARARVLAEGRLRAAQQRIKLIEHGPSSSLASGI
jgi:hypothetical protein